MEIRKAFSAIAAAVMSVQAAASFSVTAVESDLTDWTYDTFYVTMKNVTEDGTYTQWYTSEDNAFRGDGLCVTYEGRDISSDCTVAFPPGVTPKSEYDGKNLEYEFPVTISYMENNMEASIITKIGEKNDANTDCIVDVRDSALIARDINTQKNTSKSGIKPFGRFLVTGNRNENKYDLKSSNASSIAKKLSDEAVARAKKGNKVEHKGTSKYSLYLSNAVGVPGEEVTIQVVVNADNKFEALDAVIDMGNSVVDIYPAYAVGKTTVNSAVNNGMVSVVDYGDDAVANGAVANLKFKIPEDAVPGESYDINFSEVRTFSVLAGNGESSDVTGDISVKGSKVKILEPAVTTAVSDPAVTTATTATTTTTTTTTTTATTATTTSGTVQQEGYLKIESLPDRIEFDEGEEIDLSGLGVSLYCRGSQSESYDTVYKNLYPLSHMDKFSMEVVEDKDEQGKYIVKVGLSDKQTDAYPNVKPVEFSIVIYPRGDANRDRRVNVRDAAFIAKLLAEGKGLPMIADYNGDNKVNVRDSAAIATALAAKE